MSLNLTLLISLILVFFILRKLKVYFFSFKTIGIFVGVYLLLGVISFTSLKILAKEDSSLLNEEANLEVNEEEIWSLIEKNRVDEIDKSLIKEEWSFKVPGKRFSIILNEEAYGVNVVVQYRDDPNSQEVFAKTYQFPYVIDGINVEDKANILPKSEFDSSNSQFTIKGIPEQNLTFYKLTSSLFILEKSFISTEEVVNVSDSRGSTILYLNVPKHITIIDTGGIVINPSTF